MELLNFIFQLGVVFAIFGFLWGIIQIAYQLLRANSVKSVREGYLVKMVKYFFLVDVTFLFCIKENDINFNQLSIAALILLTYFIGKLQNQQNKVEMFKMVANGLPKNAIKFDQKSEIMVITFSLLCFTGFMFYPQYSANPVSLWFIKSIDSIEQATVFGFIFKVIGFIFLVNMILKMLNAFSLLLSGKPMTTTRTNIHQGDKPKDENKFDDFEEIE